MKNTGRRAVSRRLREYKKHPASAALASLTVLAAAVTAGILAFLIGYILIKGIPNIKPELFKWEYTARNVSMTPAIVNTVIITALSLVISVPLGMGTAIYLTEYARRGNKIVKLVRITAETLAGIPSIVYGLFGFLLFVVTCGWGFSILSGAMTLSVMVLPLIMRTTEEAIRSVPDSYREGSYGLGAGRLRTVLKIVVPSAMPGILSGIILSIGRIVGETAALIFTAGTVARVPASVMSSGRTLAVHMYALLTEGLYTKQAYATAVVLLVLVIFINWLSNRLAKAVVKR
ncbi:MAG: phosphate ABC transporter permease PstA [Oscillospiraceae bacterium]|jgi:phosphate transport system permease protein